jgi:paraquat-inducible protein B
MSKEVNRIAIGGFVAGGIGLAVLAMLFIGSGKYFQQKSKQVLFFEGSVKGLNVGSPVKFRGVDIGEVTKIQLTIRPENLEFFVPVYVEIYGNSVSILGGKEQAKFDDRKVVDRLVTEMGLRAQLQMQSLLTGQLFINYDFYPGTPIKKVGLEDKIYEVPTIPTALQMLTETLEEIIDNVRKVNIQEMVDDIAQTAKGANKLMNSPDLSNAVVNLNHAIQDMQRFITNAESLVGKVNRKVDSVTESFESTMDDTRKMVRNIDSRVDPIASDMESALSAIQTSFDKAENLLVGAQKLISENSKLGREISVTLESMSDASRSLEELTDYLQQHPESIITGKQ